METSRSLKTQTLASVVATLGAVGAGMAGVWTSPTIPRISADCHNKTFCDNNFEVTVGEGSWIVGCNPLGFIFSMQVSFYNFIYTFVLPFICPGYWSIGGLKKRFEMEHDFVEHSNCSWLGLPSTGWISCSTLLVFVGRFCSGFYRLLTAECSITLSLQFF